MTDEAAMTVSVDVVVAAAEWPGALPGAEDTARSAALAACMAGAADGFGDGAAAAEISVVLADDALSRRLNGDYRGRDEPTNVLSFANLDAEEAPAPGAPVLLGDVVVAFGVATAEAEKEGKTLSDHMVHLIVHGVLHLLGHDHRDRAEAERMERLEIDILARLGVSDPYAEANVAEAIGQ